MRLSLVVIYLFVIIVFSGCSKQAWYEGMKMQQQNQCGQMQGVEKEKCLRGVEKSYEQYKEERE